MGTRPALSRRRLHRAARTPVMRGALVRLAQSSRALARAGPARSPLPCARLRTLPAPARSAPRIPAPALLASAPITRMCTLSAPALPAPALPAPALPAPALPAPALRARCTRSPHTAIGPHAGPACEPRGARRAHRHAAGAEQNPREPIRTSGQPTSEPREPARRRGDTPVLRAREDPLRDVEFVDVLVSPPGQG